MEQSDRSQAELADLLGSRSRASKILSAKRNLSLDMISALSREWRITADLLVGQGWAAKSERGPAVCGR